LSSLVRRSWARFCCESSFAFMRACFGAFLARFSASFSRARSKSSVFSFFAAACQVLCSSFFSANPLSSGSGSSGIRHLQDLLRQSRHPHQLH
jgi:hypothetical protein